MQFDYLKLLLKSMNLLLFFFLVFSSLIGIGIKCGIDNDIH